MPAVPELSSSRHFSAGYAFDHMAMNRAGTGPQPLRGLHTFASQQPPPPQGRNPSLGNGRLSNGKGNATTWGFGVTVPGSQGLPSPQSRSNAAAAMASFAQAIGGSQPSTPLDLSEFPSLSSAPPQHLSQAVWGNTTQRGATQGQVQRSQLLAGGNTLTGTTAAHGTLGQGQGLPHDSAAATSHFAGGIHEGRFGLAQNPLGRLSGLMQPKTSSIEDFPPLRRSPTGEIGQARREDLTRDTEGADQVGRNGFDQTQNQLGLLQGRSELLGDLSGALDVNRQSRVHGGLMADLGLDATGMAISRASGESNLTTTGLQTAQGRNGSSVSTIANNAATSINPMAQSGAQAVGSQPLPYRQAPGPDHQGRSQDPGHDLGLEADIQSSHAAHFSESLSSMSESDRYGLDGLLHMIRNEGSDVGAIAIGQDLTALGLDLSQPDHRPLYQTFASPFAEPGSRPIEPEFYIPPCYNVHNVRPFHEQVASFADDTLFFIFYSSPRDIMQELAAVELTNRMWRYHKELKQWLTKDEGSEPVRISSTEERGCYIIFDTVTWQRTRREFVLRYEDLEGRLVSITGPAAHQAS